MLHFVLRATPLDLIRLHHKLILRTDQKVLLQRSHQRKVKPRLHDPHLRNTRAKPLSERHRHRPDTIQVRATLSKAIRSVQVRQHLMLSLIVKIRSALLPLLQEISPILRILMRYESDRHSPPLICKKRIN